MLKIGNWMVAWNPVRWGDHPKGEKAGAIRVGLWPDKTGWANPYYFTDGCCLFGWKNRVLQMFILFNTITVRDGIDPQLAHREFLKIDEYRHRISADTEGASDGPYRELWSKSVFGASD